MKTTSSQSWHSVKWPKYVAPLIDQEKIISDDFMRLWHETLPKYSLVESFIHGWVVLNAPRKFKRTLEVGAGLGEHLTYKILTLMKLTPTN
jgi:hypothetical protein